MQVNGFTCNIAGSRASSTPRTGRNHTPTSRQPTHNNTKESGLNPPYTNTGLHTTTDTKSAKAQNHSATSARFERLSPRWSALWPQQHSTPRDHRHQTGGGNCIIRGATRRRHADRTLLMLQTPSVEGTVGSGEHGWAHRDARRGCGARGRWQGLAGQRVDAPSEARAADGERAGRRPRRNPAHSRSSTRPTAAAQPSPQPQRNPAHSRSAARPTAAAQPRISQHSRWHRRGRRAGGPPPTGASSSPTQHGTQGEAARPHRDQAAHASGDSCQKPRISQHSRRHRRGHRRR